MKSGYYAGQIRDMRPDVARMLIEKGQAEDIRDLAPEPKPEEPKPATKKRSK